MNADEELLPIFKAEVADQLAQLDDLLAVDPLEWDLEGLFRLAHNVKGAARMTGVAGVVAAAHALEDLFGALRGGLAREPRVIAIARDGAAILQVCFAATETGGEAAGLAELQEAVARAVESAPAASAPASAGTTEDEPVRVEERDVAVDTIRVSIDRIDALMALGVELGGALHGTDAVARASTRIMQQIERIARDRPELARDEAIRGIAKSTRELLSALAADRVRARQSAQRFQEAVHRLRMVKIESLRAHLVRVARTAARACGREVMLAMEGADTEIDRAILDSLRDPLVHLVRNAVAHGIEPSDDRTAAGKPPVGRVSIHARAAGPWVEIVVADDGSGIDLELVAARAIARGLLTEAAAASAPREQILDLVFSPGLSTSASVSEIAGRGVGMDVVRSNVTAIGGVVGVHTTAGRGTEIRLRVPLTRLTTRALLVVASEQTFAVPLVAVERTLAVGREDVRLVDGQDSVPVGGALVGVASLAALLALPDSDRDRRPAIVVSDGHRRRALWVDAVLGDRELTFHALPWNVASGVPGVAGAALLDSGAEIALVLDPNELLGASAHAPKSGASEPATDEASRQRRVLVVDDSVTSRTLEKNILNAAGYEVLMAVNGAAALEILREHRVDVVVSDVEMPKMGGIELTRRIRATPQLERLPIVLVTSLGDDADRRRGAEAGADAYIVKGEFDQDDLLHAVSRLV